jgi:hypothetical protein
MLSGASSAQNNTSQLTGGSNSKKGLFGNKKNVFNPFGARKGSPMGSAKPAQTSSNQNLGLATDNS